jgi:short-subunit dehydrogenase
MAQVAQKPLAVITGASSGIGLELARQFGKHDHDLLIVAEDDGIHEASRKLQGEGIKVYSMRSDLATRDGVEQLVAEIKTLARPVAALAINAGVGLGGEFLHTDLDAEVKLIQLNITSAVHLAKRLVPDMVARRAGKLLFTSSIAATMPGPYEAVYAGSKAFLLSFAEALHYELKPHKITVTALMPGPTETNFFHRAGMDDTRVGTSKKDDPTEVAKQGFDALMAGKDKVFAGSRKNFIVGLASGVLPDRIKADLQARMAEPGSGRKPGARRGAA